MTDPGHASGTDRIAEVARQRGWDDEALVVNVQGDEPLVPPSVVRQAAELLVLHPEAEIATLVTPIHDLETFLDPNVVKVVTSRSGEALYFSRAPIPWDRAGGSAGSHAQTRWTDALRHVGLYAYRVGALRRLSGTAPCRLEQLERLEQLRALWLGIRVQVDVAIEVPPAGVDTPADLERANRVLAAAEPAAG
jgi:3-deoxy-manno-octulosonate cytidylyltransferase (CMP-KDO synthetase)